METLWFILYFIFICTGFLASRSYKWSIKSKILLLVLQLCLCSVLIVVGIYTNQGFFTNLICILVFLGLFKFLNHQLEKLEDETIQKVLEAQKSRTQKKQIIDAEDYTICN